LGIPAGRAEALLVELEPEPEPADPVVPVVLEPALLLLSAVADPVLLAWFLSRTMLLLTSQHWLDAAPLEPGFDVPAPCACAKPTTARSAVAEAAAMQIFFMAVSFLFDRQNTGDIQCWPIDRVPWRRNLFVNVPTALVRFITGVSHNALPRESRTRFPPEGTNSTITRRKPRVIFYGEESANRR
jgi:hypothetical protein